MTGPNPSSLENLLEIAEPNGNAVGLACRVQEQAEALCATMREIHGCQWRIHIDHQARCVLIAAHGS